MQEMNFWSYININSLYTHYLKRLIYRKIVLCTLSTFNISFLPKTYITGKQKKKKKHRSKIDVGASC